MKAMILAAGLGTRLRPWTLEHPKALVPVNGVPMLERVIRRLDDAGFNEIVVNVHHFGEQIIDFLEKSDFGVKWSISDERDMLLDTGGGLRAAAKKLFAADDRSFLVHNADILSNADLSDIFQYHEESGNDVTLLTSGRESSRKLVFNESGQLCGWHDVKKDYYLPEGFRFSEENHHESAFSGIYVVGSKVLEELDRFREKVGSEVFPVIPFFLDSSKRLKIGERFTSDLDLIDIGKPATLERANMRLMEG